MMRKTLLLLVVFAVAGISCQLGVEEVGKPVKIEEAKPVEIEEAKPVEIEEAKPVKEEGFKMPDKPVVVMETNRGTIKWKLFPEVAPLACENMIRLAEKGYYDGVIFHRVIKRFMLQGGDPEGTGRGGQSIWNRNFADEFSDQAKFDRKGLLAMANAGPGTNGSQFFITVAPCDRLNGKHTIFGEVIAGYEVVEAIEKCPVGSGDRPRAEQKILNIRMEK